MEKVVGISKKQKRGPRRAQLNSLEGRNMFAWSRSIAGNLADAEYRLAPVKP